MAGGPTSSATAGGPAGGQAHRHQVALEARSYLEEHCILPFVERMLRKLIHERPSNPWDSIANLLPQARKLSAAEVEETTRKGRAPGDPTVAATAVAPVTLLDFTLEHLDYA